MCKFIANALGFRAPRMPEIKQPEQPARTTRRGKKWRPKTDAKNADSCQRVPWVRFSVVLM